MEKTIYCSPRTGKALYAGLLEGKLCDSEKIEHFPLVNGVPYFSEVKSFGEKETQRVFGAEWSTFTEYDADNLEKMSYGMDSFFVDKNVLEVGCGAGRHSRRLIDRYGAASVAAIDLSDAVFVANKLNVDFDNISVANANVFHLPFRDEEFDIGFSLGVLMHTENPKRAFGRMCEKIKKRGHAVIWVYAKTPRKYFMEFFRFFTKNAPTSIQKLISHGLSMSLWPMVLLSKKLNIHLSNHFREYAKYDYYVYKTDMYDRISAPLIGFYSEGEIQKWFQDVGFDEIEVTTYGDFFVRGVGRYKR